MFWWKRLQQALEVFFFHWVLKKSVEFVNKKILHIIQIENTQVLGISCRKYFILIVPNKLKIVKVLGKGKGEGKILFRDCEQFYISFQIHHKK